MWWQRRDRLRYVRVHDYNIIINNITIYVHVCVRSRCVLCVYNVARRRAVNDRNAQRSSTRYRIVINNNNNNAWLRIGMSGEEGWGILTSGFGPMSNNNSVRFDVVLRDYFRFLLLYMFNSPLVNSYHLLLIGYWYYYSLLFTASQFLGHF